MQTGPISRYLFEFLSTLFSFQLVSCKMDTAHKTVTFRFAPDSDKPPVIAAKLVDQDCLTECHVNAVVEQLEKVIEVIKENPEKVG